MADSCICSVCGCDKPVIARGWCDAHYRSCGKGHEACVNPRHLYWGTPIENAADRVRHGTHLKGEDCASAKLTVDQVREIRRLSLSLPQREVADRFGISKQRVSKIVRREQWGWLQ